jgi:hypothetical protein
MRPPGAYSKRMLRSVLRPPSHRERRRFLEYATGKALSDFTVGRLLKRMGFSQKTECGGDRTRRVAKSRLEGDGLGELGPGTVCLRRRSERWVGHLMLSPFRMCELSSSTADTERRVNRYDRRCRTQPVRVRPIFKSLRHLPRNSASRLPRRAALSVRLGDRCRARPSLERPDTHRMVSNRGALSRKKNTSEPELP